MFFNDFADVVVSASDVFGALVVFGIVGEIARGGVVGGELKGHGGWWAYFVGEFLEVDAEKKI